MILFPECQKKAQAQIEAVCGDRLPEMEDYDDLLYIRSIMKEVFRWLPTATLGAVLMSSHPPPDAHIADIISKPSCCYQGRSL